MYKLSQYFFEYSAYDFQIYIQTSKLNYKFINSKGKGGKEKKMVD